MSSSVFQLTEELGFPSSSEEAFFPSLSMKKEILSMPLFSQVLMAKCFAEKDYSLQPTFFNKVFVEVCASVMALVLSPERASLLIESVSLLR